MDLFPVALDQPLHTLPFKRRRVISLNSGSLGMIVSRNVHLADAVTLFAGWLGLGDVTVTPGWLKEANGSRSAHRLVWMLLAGRQGGRCRQNVDSGLVFNWRSVILAIVMISKDMVRLGGGRA